VNYVTAFLDESADIFFERNRHVLDEENRPLVMIFYKMEGAIWDTGYHT
jgi:hypothetical protein